MICLRSYTKEMMELGLPSEWLPKSILCCAASSTVHGLVKKQVLVGGRE